ncbi:hypothetical protein TNCV_3251731 [Trichonephila clavipes]|nr:hypothetical protein TNCV_3251731 [Trichonephila clavipes]
MSECLLMSRTRAIADGVRHFQPQPNDEDNALGGTPLFELPHQANVTLSNLDKFNAHQLFFMVDLQRHEGFNS